MMGGMAIVYSYVRFSTPAQLKGDSLRRQLAATDEFVKRGNHTLASLSLRDLGVSGFRGQNATKGALAKFLEAVQQGSVQPGSILAVECIDRISRAQVTEALQLFLQIISAGITVATLQDEKMYSIESINKNPMDLMFSILVMMRANEESMTKSKRSLANWENKRQRAVAEKKPATPLCPTWLRLVDGRYVPLPERVKILKKIVKLVIDGFGIRQITCRLNRENVPPFRKKIGKTGKPAVWEPSVVRHLTQTRATIGEYQPHKLVEGRKVAVGQPIRDYFPKVLTEAEWYSVQHAIASRTKARSYSPRVNNIFGTLCRDSTGDPYTVNYVTRNRKYRKPGQDPRHSYRFIPSDAKKGLRPAGNTSFPYEPFEKSFLHWTVEVVTQLRSPSRRDEQSRLVELGGKLVEITTKLQKVQAAIAAAGGDRFDSMLQVLAELESQKRQTVEEMEAEKSRQHGPQVLREDLVGLVEDMYATGGDDRLVLRTKLRAITQSLVKEIRLYVAKNGMTKVAAAHVELENRRHRFFAVRVERGREPVTYSDTVLWSNPGDVRSKFAAFYGPPLRVPALQAVPAVDTKAVVARHLQQLVNQMISAKTCEGMGRVWAEGLEGLRRLDRLFPAA